MHIQRPHLKVYALFYLFIFYINFQLNAWNEVCGNHVLNLLS